MKNNLLISLGHNSSACLIKENGEICGYEQERIDGIKSSSNSPLDSILQIIKHEGIESVKNSNVFITHWFDNFPEKLNKKYLCDKTLDLLEKLNCHIVTHKEDFTHHDAHAFSAYSFFYENLGRNHKNYLSDENSDVHVIVADGFGNNQEVLSIYGFNYLKNDEPLLLKRFYGYHKSLGLMYQYATSFCGMKENQDEYKFLGYESIIKNYLSVSSIEKLKDFCSENFDNIFSKDIALDTSKKGFINTDYLFVTKSIWHSFFNSIVDKFLSYNSEESKRAIIGFSIQYLVERFFGKLCTDFNIKNVVLSGGCFYNVKLNNHIFKQTKGVFCVLPLAGDQGASFGFLSKLKLDFKFGDLCYGDRGLDSIEKFEKNVFYNENDFINQVSKSLDKDNCVDIVKGKMEFGPRALCNTTTLLKPNKENVKFNNTINGRNEIMPCAPVIRESDISFFFRKEDVDRVVGSHGFMIMTFDYLDSVDYVKYSGIMHKHPEQDIYTGRPQIVKDNSIIGKIIKNLDGDLKALVNTSFNVHGRPICFDTKEVLQNYKYQLNIANQKAKNIDLVILK